MMHITLTCSFVNLALLPEVCLLSSRRSGEASKADPRRMADAPAALDDHLLLWWYDCGGV